ncbi:MFS general substrate transporter [Armillaria novae-zelandiae]|uniref:MFS general substrate transporter n=1 Tax=Armillaria novae-zelandiae TaxID=153914 RepID=A0AA39T862_9AGAR|nr:MFS general substrate transporter [Armillaria novae-zelandiae]
MFGYLQHFTMLAPPSRKSAAPELKEETTLDDLPLALTNSTEYTLEQYKRLNRKVDYYLLSLLWLCGPMSVFGLREDTGLVGQQYSWSAYDGLFYRMPMLRISVQFSTSALENGQDVYTMNDFAQLVALRALQGIFQCCNSSGSILMIGSWYTRKEHSSRSLVFVVGQPLGASVYISLIPLELECWIGNHQYRGTGVQAWRCIAYFLGSLTVFVGIVSLRFLGTPSEVTWLTKEEERMANIRILENQSGHNRTGVNTWKWYQLRECLIDPCVYYFTGIVVFFSAAPITGFSAFRGIIDTGFGFSNLLFKILNFLAAFATSKQNNLRLYRMALVLVPGFIGTLAMALIETDESNKCTKWGMYLMTAPFRISMSLAWTLIPSNVIRHTKRTVTSSFTFVSCV